MIFILYITCIFSSILSNHIKVSKKENLLDRFYQIDSTIQQEIQDFKKIK